MTVKRGFLACALLCAFGCGDDGDAHDASEPPGHEDAGGTDAGRTPDSAVPDPTSGEFLALTYNVAGLPMGLSSSMPELYTPMIAPLLNDYDVVLVQESWQTPDPNPAGNTGLRVYHEILVEASEHPYKSEPAAVPWGTDPERPDALLGDGLNMFSIFPFGETTRVRWPTCVITSSDCLALKGFSMTQMELADGAVVHVYNLHMEAGSTREDDDARDQDIDLLVEFMTEMSDGAAVIVGGDFNLHTDTEPAASQLARLLDETGLSDACTEFDCDRPGSLDKFLFRSSEELEIRAEEMSFETDVFVSDDGQPLSDHDPLAVRFAWSLVE